MRIWEGIDPSTQTVDRIEGQVVQFAVRNPHSFLSVNAPGDSGAARQHAHVDATRSAVGG
jgi:Rps23 Pro-64 3,4-dihydroxylase Tpa1-like proline 4-hydroxylase